MKLPKYQSYHDYPPKTSQKRSLREKRRTLKESIGHFIRLRSDPHQPHQNATPTAVLQEGNAPLLLRKDIQDSMSADIFIDISEKEITAKRMQNR